MKKWSIVCLAACLMISMAACTSGGTDPTEAEDGAAAPAPETESAAAIEPAPATPEPAAAVTTPDAAPAETVAAPAAATGLEGTTWKIDEFTVAFKDATTINVKGGPLGDGEGIPGTYTVENGAITINAMGQSKSGTWDGTNLSIDNTPAVKM